MSWLARLWRSLGRGQPLETNRPKKERRRYPRIAVGLEMPAFVDGVRRRSELRDISEGGLFLCLREPVELASKATVRMTANSELCRAVGRVVRVEPARGVGILFERKNEHLRRFVDDLVRAEERTRPDLVERILAPGISIGHR